MAATRVLSVLSIALGLTVAACHPSGRGDPSDTTAVTNRPQDFDRFIAILKLKTPALLSSAQKVNGKVVVDDSLRDLINAEQAQTIADLTALSPDLKILYQYKMVLNGLAIVAPKALEAKFRGMDAVSYVEGEGPFERMAPVALNDTAAQPAEDINNKNSVGWIGAKKLQDTRQITGKGIVVGVIDTGIDYTHAMFGGAGTEQAYKDIDPSLANPGFPTAKVIGGVDLVGTAYDDASVAFENHVPKGDANPLDEAGHGSHVSGTIAGAGNGTDTYSGVAPDAKLFALKVFGKAGSTGDAVIIEALELAADPSGTMDPAQHLDVVNLSLGGGFGSPHTLYAEAVKNLVNGDTVMVASAGNSGSNAYIVGSPSTADDALSVAATIDNMDHNWRFGAVLFKTVAHPEVFAEAIEASFAKPIAQAGNVVGKLVYVGNAAVDLTDAQKAAVQGNIALIDRGVVPFAEKARRANEAGATGVVVANNQPGDAFSMGGDGSFPIPAIMISKDLGDALKADMGAGDATISFQTDHKIEKPELIDSVTAFSSRGPRSVDGALKPEIAAPGANVISAKMGSGSKGVQFSGTSMAAPHMSGVMALLKQARPELDARALKALVMETALSLTDPKTKAAYAVATMGAGRVQAFEAAAATLLANPPVLSLGEVLVEQAKTVRQTVTLTNLTDLPTALTLKPVVKAGLAVTAPATLALAAHESKAVVILVKITPPTADDTSLQLDGFLEIASDAGASYHLPLLAVIDRATTVAAKNLVVHATSAADAAGAAADLTIANLGLVKGEALLFNLLATDPRKNAARRNQTRNGICDLESAGWRVLKQGGKNLIQFAVKLYNPVTTWQLCGVSVLIDKDSDGLADQELLGSHQQELSNNEADYQAFHSFLTDATAMRKIRHDYELAAAGTAAPTYTSAVVDVQPYQAYGHSTIAVVTADLAQVATTTAGDLKVQLVVSADTTSPEGDDVLGAENQWLTLTPSVDGQAFVDLPETLTLDPGTTQTVALTKGNAKGKLVVYLPFNRSTTSSVATDDQGKVLAPKYKN